MNGDLSRVTFDKINHYTRVVMQQGRVQLDADFNEQTAILLHYLQTLAADLIGRRFLEAQLDRADAERQQALQPAEIGNDRVEDIEQGGSGGHGRSAFVTQLVNAQPL